MGSSPGFGSNPCDSGGLSPPMCPLQTRFRFGSGCNSLNLATEIDSLGPSPRGTRSGLPPRTNPTSSSLARLASSGIALPLLVGIRFQVLFHSGHPGSFHLSLTVLVRYRSPRVFSLRGWTPLVPTRLACPVVLKATGRSLLTFVYGAITLYGRPFQTVWLASRLVTPLGPCRGPAGPYYPRLATTAAFSTRRVWAVPLSLATTQGILSFPGGSRMFRFPPFPPPTYVFSRRYPGIPPGGLPHSDISGSKPAHGSPELFAVGHVLLRLLAPRHPPYALCSLFHAIRDRIA